MKISNLQFLGQDFKVYIRSQADKSILKEIFELREYQDVESIIKSAKTPIIDAGAQAGFFGLYCRSFNKTVPIYALEPAEDNLQIMADNLTLNNIAGVEIIPAVLSGQSVLRDFYLSSDTHNHGLFKLLVPKVMRTEKVKAISLADFLQSHNLEQVSLLKMDIEGAEYEVLASFSEWSKIDNIVFEYHDFSEHKHQQLERILLQAGYQVTIRASKFGKDLGFILAV